MRVIFENTKISKISGISAVKLHLWKPETKCFGEFGESKKSGNQFLAKQSCAGKCY